MENSMDQIIPAKKEGERTQDEYLAEQKELALKQLKPEHQLILDRFIKENGSINANWMLTTQRDGEPIPRSIYNYRTVFDAIAGYDQYQDWGFAKDHLTIKLWGPGGLIAEKTLKRPQGGVCTFVRSDYIEAENIILKIKQHLDEETYKSLVKDFAGLFSRDSIRFDVSRFFKQTECEEVFE